MWMWLYSRSALFAGLDLTTPLTVLEGAAELGRGSRGYGSHEDGAGREEGRDELHLEEGTEPRWWSRVWKSRDVCRNEYSCCYRCSRERVEVVYEENEL
jgi:hypothetical protein